MLDRPWNFAQSYDVSYTLVTSVLQYSAKMQCFQRFAFVKSIPEKKNFGTIKAQSCSLCAFLAFIWVFFITILVWFVLHNFVVLVTL